MVGYWPREIFTMLGYTASYIAVGGEAYNSQYEPLTPMGNGYFPKADAQLSAHCGRFAVLNEDHKVVDPDQTDLLVTNSSYGVIDVKDYGDLGRTVFFGGTTRD
uniref:Neprosin PEP catalytic domain-containing protein n=1 Tax=Chenopodium quinoa TaxID=63459 RepID=A0A803LWX8_CHEQI